MDMEEFLKILAKEKGKIINSNQLEGGINVDFFSIEEIKKIIERESTANHDFSKMRLSGFEENRVIFIN